MHIEVYSRRWGHNDKYSIERTLSGWKIGYVSIGGECDKKGVPFLFGNLDHDLINYPQDLGDYLEFLWDKIDDEGMTEEQIQAALDQLGRWIQETEKASPGGIFSNFK